MAHPATRRRPVRPNPANAGAHARILAVVSAIPRGKVATYGQVAALADLPGRARMVGYALAALPPGSRVPWQRVINARGCISPRTGGDAHERQRRLLEAEGVRFAGGRGVVDLARFGWDGR